MTVAQLVYAWLGGIGGVRQGHVGGVIIKRKFDESKSGKIWRKEGWLVYD